MSATKRDEWVFAYKAGILATAAKKQMAHREERAQWWLAKKQVVMAEVKESGIEVSESVASLLPAYTQMAGPQVMVRTDLQAKLTECHRKIAEHQAAMKEYDGWEQFLSSNPQATLELTQRDWLYFFAK